MKTHRASSPVVLVPFLLGCATATHQGSATLASPELSLVSSPKQAAPEVQEPAAEIQSPQDPKPRNAAAKPGATGNQPADRASLERRIAELERRLNLDPDFDSFQEDEQVGGAAPGEDDASGTDPRAFGTKFMPYYRYTRLKSDLRANELTMFGLVRLSDNLAATYEFPVAKQLDYSSVREFQAGGSLPPSGVPGPGPGNGGPAIDLDADGDTAGTGDTILRLFYKNEFFRSSFSIREDGSSEIMPLFEVTVPTASEDILGGDALILSPGFAAVIDMPAMGFFAAMNFFDFDGWRDDSRVKTRRYRGRWFYMQPITPPAFMAKDNPDIPDLGIWSGIYLMPELQPVYDFENSEFSVWLAPEIGKIYKEGQIIYAKPGWTFDPERQDRQFTLEVGWRYFF
ncbi:MAG: hypothetical protein ACYTG5_15915 [Planctomycetota bacterium]|jgi:hypothetical protein